MNAIDPVVFVVAQLKESSPGVEWNISGIDRLNELARIFVRAGVVSLWELRPFWTKTTVDNPRFIAAQNRGSDPWNISPTIEVDALALDYKGKQIGFLGSPAEAENQSVLHKSDKGYEIAWSAEGHGHVGYILSVNKTTGKLQFQPVWGSSSDLGEIREFLMTGGALLAFTFLPMANISVGSFIGNAVLPSTLAATYPTLATSIGNVALATVFNGGDVGQAVESVVKGFAAGAAGDFTGSLADSKLIGTLTTSATNAAIRGESIGDAVALSALSYGASNMQDLFSEPTPINEQSVFGDSFNAPPTDMFLNSGDAWNFDSEIFSVPMIPPSLETAVPIDTLSDIADGFNPVGFDPFESSFQQYFSNPLAVPTIGTSVPPPESQTYSASQIVQGITGAAMAVISVIKAYKNLDAPTIQPTARVVNADGSVSVVGNNGLIQTRTNDGRVIAQKPPVGIPQATTTGNYIVNNGDGTYTIVSPNGDSRTMAYSQTSESKSAISLPLLGIGAATLFLIARRKG